MEFFDCNCSFGKSMLPPFRYAADAEELIQEMDFCGIDRALVYQANMRFGSPGVWNPRLAEAVVGQERLEASWAILPPQTSEVAQPEQFLEAMEANGISAVRAFPQEHRYFLNKDTFADLFELLGRRRIPLFAKDNLARLKDLLDDFPELIVVAVNQGPHSVERYLRPILDKHPNLYLETSYCIVAGLIEEYCDRYGPERLLFGTAFPDNCSGAALLRLAQADIGHDARAGIAGGNLQRLLREAEV